MNIFKKLNQWIANLLVDACTMGATNVFTKVSNMAESIGKEAGKSPIGFSTEMYVLVNEINNKIVVPIAGLILTYIAVTQLIHMINDKNTFVDYELQSLFKWILTVSIAVWLVSHSMAIVMSIFSIGTKLTKEVTDLVVKGDTVDFMSHVATITEQAKAFAADGKLMPLFSLSFGLLILSGFITVVSIFVPVIIYVRFFYIYMNLAIASIPMATLTSSKVSSIGENYLKSTFALSFQAMFMVLAVALFSAFITYASSLETVTEILLALGSGAIMLVLLLLKTESISKSIFNAH